MATAKSGRQLSLSAASTAGYKRLSKCVLIAADRCPPAENPSTPILCGSMCHSAAEWDAKQGTKKFVLHYPATADKDLGLNPDLHVTSQTPPTFLLQAEDDHVDSVNESLTYYIALKNAGVPVEMHLYAQGGRSGCGARSFRSPNGLRWWRRGWGRSE